VGLVVHTESPIACRPVTTGFPFTTRRRSVLCSGLREARATDIIWALVNPRTHHSLVAGRRWSADEYQRWLADLLASALRREPAG
jgi:hypothetical protein